MVQDLSFPSNIGLFLTVSRDYSVQYSLLKSWGMAPAKGRASRFPRQALRFENEESAPFPNLSLPFPISRRGPGKEQLGGSAGYCRRVQCHEDARAEITCSK